MRCPIVGSMHPQWAVMDLRAAKQASAVEIAWASPHAKVYEMGYWVGSAPLSRAPEGKWKTFSAGTAINGQGGTVTLKLDAAVSTRCVRSRMTESSNTCDVHGSDDVCNCAGYAIQGFKVVGAEGNASYTTSSIDPWHSASDANATGGGRHCLPRSRVTVLYGTPDNAAAQIALHKEARVAALACRGPAYFLAGVAAGPVVELFAHVRGMDAGMIPVLEVRGGLPFSKEIEHARPAPANIRRRNGFQRTSTAKISQPATQKQEYEMDCLIYNSDDSGRLWPGGARC